MIRAMLSFPPGEAVPDELISGLSALEGIELTVARDPGQALGGIAGIEVLFTLFADRRLIEAARSLRWIQALISGTDRIALTQEDRRRIVLTSAHGLHGDAVSEAALSLMLALARDIPRALRSQGERLWRPWNATLLAGRTLVIVGVGAISEALALKCKALGMRVEGISRTVRAVSGFERIRPRDELRQAAASADFLVLLASADPGTERLIDADVIAAMKSSAFLINVARGSLVDDDALIEALRGGRLAGAALDSVTGEPLAPEHRYWDVPRVLITPHMAGRHEGYWRSLVPLIRSNWNHYVRGEPGAMRNLVTK